MTVQLIRSADPGLAANVCFWLNPAGGRHSERHLQYAYGLLSPLYRLGVVAQRHGGARVPGKLGDVPHLDPLGL